MTLRSVAGPVRVRVPGKINLRLAVGDARPDGYHDLITVFQAVDLTDELVVAPSARTTVHTNPPIGVPVGAKNLAAAAARLLADHTGMGTPVAIDITKQIPVAGGMAGGSADAAAALVGCAALWGVDIGRDELAGLAAQLGSDVPFALSGGTAVGTGRGELLSPVLTRMSLHWVLAFSAQGLPTPQVFAELDRMRTVADPPRLDGVEPMLTALASGEVKLVAAALGNDLQSAAISLQPALRRTLRAGLDAGALGALVSGSGPTVALLCTDHVGATEVAARLAGTGTCAGVRVVAGPATGARLVSAVQI